MGSLRVLHSGDLSTHLLDEGGKAVPEHPVGTLAVAENGKTYRYVRNTDVALDTYSVATYSDMSKSEVTQEVASGLYNNPAGVYDQSTQIAVGEYFWIQVAGEAQVNVENTATIVVGDALIPHITNDGEADEVDPATLGTVANPGIGAHFATAIAAIVAGTPDTVRCRLIGLV